VYRQTEGERFKRPTGVFVDRESGDVLVADSGNNLISVLNRDGVPIHSIGYNGEIPQPLMAVTDSSGRILALAGVPQKVKILSYRGEFQGDFTFPGYTGAAQALPVALTADRAGNVYIADGTTGRILMYDAEWRLRLNFGGRADGPGGFSNVTAITVDSTGNIYVADAQHTPSIQVFDAGGAYIRGWGEHSAGPHNFSLPSGITIDAAGRVLVADRIRQVVSVFTPEGQYLFRFGGLGNAPGDLGFPSGLDADGAGRLYVAETVNARLQFFESASTGSGRGDAPTRRSAPALPPRQREEINKGLGETLKGLAK
jgi:DNA-binding beta-propeller fold protein YncE